MTDTIERRDDITTPTPRGIAAVVPWLDFRHALAAVLPHAAKEKDAPDLSVVRVHLTGSDDTVVVSATDTFTAGVATVKTIVPSPEPDFIDVPAASVRKILAVFGEESGEFAPDFLLQLDHYDLTLRVTDVSGMVNGETLVVDVAPTHWSNPDLRLLVARSANELLEPFSQRAYRLERLKRFQAAEKYFGDYMLLSTVAGTRSVFVTVGATFAGMIMPVPGDMVTSHREEWTHVGQLNAPPRPAEAPSAASTVVDLANYRVERASADTDTELLAQAAELVIATQFGSPSMLQRKLRVGLARAIRLLDDLEEFAVVVQEEGTSTRRVIAQPSELADVLADIRGAQGDDDEN